MTEKKYRVHDLVKFDYSQIKQYVGVNYTDRPLRNDEVVDVLNKQHEQIKRLKRNFKALNEVKCEIAEENEQLKELVNEAEDIILCQCTPHYQGQWENIKKNLKGDVE